MARTRKFLATILACTTALVLLHPSSADGPRKLASGGALASIGDVDSPPAGSYTTDPAACGLEIAGWEKHDNTFPIGRWEPYFADSPAACAEACAAHSERCAAVLWEDSKVLPYSDDAKCQFVIKLAGFQYNMPDGITLYTPCEANCGTEIAGYEKHENAFPSGTWEAYFADSAASCAAACTAHSDRCVGALWIDTDVLPYADDAKCQFVTSLAGVTPGMPDGVDLYLPCQQ